ncbi:MAG: hypothetical protein VB858_07670 [Planctomycetaceae bacterium]
MSESVLPAEPARQEPSLPDRLSAWGDRFSDRLNPILVKETRQALKSRQFTITFMLLLIVAWLISVIFTVWAGATLEFGSAGRALFIYYYFALVVAVLLVVPFNTFRSMITERDQNTYELLSISTLTPGQIVRGKLNSSMAQVLIYYSAIAPFIAFTSLLQGFDLPLVAYMLVMTFLWAAMTCMVALTISTLSGNRQWQAFNTIGIILLLIWQVGGILGTGAYSVAQSLPVDDHEFWWVTGFCLLAAGSYFVLFQQIAISQLTFESDNRSTGIRVTSTIQLFLAWLILFLAATVSGVRDLVEVVVTFPTLHIFTVGLFASTENDFLSRRIRRTLPRPAALRYLKSPLLPGGSCGFLYVLLHMAVIASISQWNFCGLAASQHRTMARLGIVLSCYSMIYLGFGAIAGRWCRKITPAFRPIHTRVLIILIAILAMLVPYLLPGLGLVNPWLGYSLFELTNPFATIDMLYRQGNDVGSTSMGEVAKSILLFAASLAVIVNLRWMISGVIKLKRYEPNSTDPETHSAPADTQTTAPTS